MKETINSSEALIAYLDILGYSDLVASGEYANVYYAAINTSISRWRQFVERHKYDLGKIVQQHVTLEIMSDAFIVTLDQQAALSESESENTKQIILMIFFTLISYLVQDCTRAIKHLFRGAIVKGQHYRRNFESLEGGTFIFSKALYEAYYLERNIAHVPRILVDKSVLEGVDISLLCKESRPDRELLRDDDGFYHLNIYGSMFDDTALAPILQEVASIVRANIEQGNAQPNHRQKYVWFANYHNAVIRDIIESKAAIPSFEEIKAKRQEMLIEIPSL